MSPAATETSSYLLLTFSSTVFFLLHWNCGISLFFSCIPFFPLSMKPVCAAKLPSITRFHSPLPHSRGLVQTCVREHACWCVLPVHSGAAASEAAWKESFDVGLSKKSTVRLSPLGTSRKMFTFISNNLQHQAYIFTSITVRHKPCWNSEATKDPKI